MQPSADLRLGGWTMEGGYPSGKWTANDNQKGNAPGCTRPLMVATLQGFRPARFVCRLRLSPPQDFGQAGSFYRICLPLMDLTACSFLMRQTRSYSWEMLGSSQASICSGSGNSNSTPCTSIPSWPNSVIAKAPHKLQTGFVVSFSLIMLNHVVSPVFRLFLKQNGSA